jgi:DNA-binding response OmpR family regulator
VIRAGANGRPAVLLVEDEVEIVSLMRDFLEAEGFEVHAAASGSAAVAALGRSRVDCVLLDVMLQGESGFDVCRRLRDRSGVPILFLSARGEDSDKIRGLRLGGDDYVVKSATPTEVVERVKAVLRRAGPAGSVERPVHRFGSLEVDLAAHEAIVGGRPVQFTAKEFAILELLVEHPRQVFSRDHLFELIWGDFGDRSAVGSKPNGGGSVSMLEAEVRPRRFRRPKRHLYHFTPNPSFSARCVREDRSGRAARGRRRR